MGNNSMPGSHRGPSATKVACTTVFVVFTFSWLYWFQADLLAVAQHGLSHGITSYNRTLGALILTVSLLLVQLIVYALTRLERRTHALTYLPSFLLLAFVSSVSSPFKWGAWLWAAPLVLLLWAGAVILAKKALPFDYNSHLSTGLISRLLWLNMLQMGGMMLGVAAASNTNAVDHFKAHAEVALMHGDADKALRVGRRSLESDPTLTMLRIFALSQKGQLADHLFDYSISGSSHDMLPLAGSKSSLHIMPDTLLWDHFGVRPDSIVARANSAGIHRILGGALTTSQYLDSLANDSLASPAWRDYRLMGLLIDRKLEPFAQRMASSSALDSVLPRHYREALVLYRERIDTSFVYDDSVMTARWHSYCRYDSLYPLKSERRIRLEEEFRNTYWYYYYQ